MEDTKKFLRILKKHFEKNKRDFVINIDQGDTYYRLIDEIIQDLTNIMVN